jgi:hypothetical protein
MDNSWSRRGVLGTLALAGAALVTAAFALPARAVQKLSQVAAKYRSYPNGSDHCQICLQFDPPDGCKIVEGKINPYGWCQYFAAKKKTD